MQFTKRSRRTWRSNFGRSTRKSSLSFRRELEQLRQENVAAIDGEGLKIAKCSHGMNAALPATGQIMRLKVREFQPVFIFQLGKKLVLGSQRGRDFIDNVDVIRFTNEMTGKNQRNRTADDQPCRLMQSNG